MTKHTPGQWKIEDETFVYATYPNKHNRFFITISTGCHCDDCEITSMEELKANARLIAAAQELLNALISLLDKCDAEWKIPGIWPETRNDARRAIAKAEGK